MMTETQLREADGALAHYYRILRRAPRELVVKAFSACLAAGVRPDIEVAPEPDSPRWRFANAGCGVIKVIETWRNPDELA
jgi:hypothetical protein